MLYLGNLPFDSNEMQVMKYLSESGFKPLRGKMNMDRDTGKSKGCAFVQMSSIKEAERAITELTGNHF
jgi:RNA recognition motif-containing protein